MATYSIEDIVIELIIQLPSNYPLGSITVESGRRVGVAVQQWRNWMLQLSTYLTHQVGSRTHWPPHGGPSSVPAQGSETTHFSPWRWHLPRFMVSSGVREEPVDFMDGINDTEPCGVIQEMLDVELFF